MAEKTNPVEVLKALVAVAFVFAGIATFYHYSDKAMVIRVGAVLGGMAAAALMFLTTEWGRQFKTYAQESVEETRKVVWPTRKETLQTTGIVFVFVLIMALFLWMVDGSLLWVVQKLIGRGAQ
ncbi:MAG: preprotein translocase subunit SecE [Betaproteobacteria bacterium]|nr:preprotein translocase subunit SecE [Betaproteobacteria bacterium]